MYPKEINENKKYRLEVLTKAENDKELQSVLLAKCSNDVLYFFNVFAWTYNPRTEPFDFPFITYPFQDEFIKNIVLCIENEQNSCTEKSRDMGFSWQIVGIHVWAFLFKGWSSLYGSYKEDYVDRQGNLDSFFERCRYMINRLPQWMIPNDLQDKYMSINSQSKGAEIAGDSGQNFGTGGRRKFITLDEFALWNFDEKAFRKTTDITNCRIIGGTPEGKMNIYGKIMTNHKDYEHLSIKKIRLHWKDHPLKTEQWYEDEKKKRTPLDIAKELDISYEASVTGAVYPGFQRICRFGEYKYDPKLHTFTSWDFGRDSTAIIWVQYDPMTDTHYIIDSFRKSKLDDPNIVIEFFRPFVTGNFENYNYNDEEIDKIHAHHNWRYNGHFGDPYNLDSKTINTESSINDKLMEKGMFLQKNTKSTLNERITKTELFFPKLCIDERNYDFINCINQSRYPTKSEGSQATSEGRKPIHDDNSHYRTALEYYIDNAPKPIHENQKIIIQNKRIYDEVI